MSEFYNDQWRLPNNENKDKVSNYSMDFDGSSQYVDFTGLPDFGGGSLSISFWINSGVDTSNAYVLMRSGFSFYIYQSGTASNLRYRVQTSALNTINGGAILDNNWHHCVMTFDSSANEFKVFEDGSQVGSTVTTSGSLASSTSNVYLATFAAGAPFKSGQFDGLSFFNYALSQSQITTLYGSSSTGIGNPMSLSPKPVAYYPLGDQDAFNGANYLVPNSSLKDYVFDFDSDYVTLNSSINLTGNKTVSYWVKPVNLNGNVYIGGVSPNYYTYMTSTLLAIKDSTGFSSFTISISTGNWYHICITGDGTNATLYINGDIIGTAADKNPTIDTIGGYSYGGAAPHSKFSNVQIFNTALPATGSNSVETLYNNGSPLTSMTGFTSLQGWWKLDASDTYDGTNWTIEDHAGSNDGISSGMTQANLVQSDLSFTSGYSPYALDFDGTNERVDTSSISALDNATKFTLSTWVYWDTTGNSNEWLFMAANSNRSIRVHLELYNQVLYFRFLGATGQVGVNMINNSWVNVVAVFDNTASSSDKIIIYLNGLKPTQLSYIEPTGNSPTGMTIASIGGRTDGYGFNGRISNFSVWNAALTSPQVTEIYNEGVPSNLNNHSAYSNLVSWWQLGSNSSYTNKWICLDEKGTNNGESVNMTEANIVDGVGSSANGLSSGMGGDEVIGDAPYSSSNSLSINMDVLDRVEDTPA